MTAIDLIWILLLLSLPAITYADLFSDYEQQMLREDSRRASKKLNHDFLMKGKDSPKEVIITCEGSPQITINDLISDATSGFVGGECMVIKLRGGNFNFRLSLNCNDVENSDFEYDSDVNGDSGDLDEVDYDEDADGDVYFDDTDVDIDATDVDGQRSDIDDRVIHENIESTQDTVFKEDRHNNQNINDDNYSKTNESVDKEL